MEKRTCLSVLESLRSVNSQVYSTSRVHTASRGPRTNLASICLHFGPAPCSQITKNLVSFSILVFLFSLQFFSSLLANLISPPPLSSLPLLSSFSHAPVGEHNTIAMAVLCMVCVCVMSHHNGSIVALSFFNPCAHRPHCYFQIL